MTESKENDTTNGCYIPKWLKADHFVEFLQENIENFVKIQKFIVTPALNAGENYATILLHISSDVQLKDGNTQKLTFMAKVLPETEESQLRVKNWKFFDKELNVYSKYILAFEDLYKKAGKRIKFGPKMLNVKTQDAGEQFLIMENLRERGFQNVKRQQGLDMQHAKCTLEKLAQFHAASACYFEENGPYPEIYERSICTRDGVDELKEYRESMCRFLCESLPLMDVDVRHLEKNLKYYCTEVPDQYQVKSKIDRNKFNVLNHGDCWVNNIMFQYDESDTNAEIKDVYFVDYQMGRYGSPAQDLFYFLLSSICLENKIKQFDYFIFYYHQKLIENLKLLKYAKELPTLRDLHVSLFENGDWAFIITTGLLPIILVDPANDANVDNVLNDNANADNFKRRAFTNERYVKDMSQILPWMEQRGFLEFKELP